MSRIYGEADRTLGNFIQGTVDQEVIGLHNRHASDDREIGSGGVSEGLGVPRRQRSPAMDKLVLAYPSPAHNKHFAALEAGYKEFSKYHAMVGKALHSDPKNKVLRVALKEAGDVLDSLQKAIINWQDAETALYRS